MNKSQLMLMMLHFGEIADRDASAGLTADPSASSRSGAARVELPTNLAKAEAAETNAVAESDGEASVAVSRGSKRPRADQESALSTSRGGGSNAEEEGEESKKLARMTDAVRTILEVW